MIFGRVRITRLSAASERLCLCDYGLPGNTKKYREVGFPGENASTLPVPVERIHQNFEKIYVKFGLAHRDNDFQDVKSACVVDPTTSIVIGWPW